MSTTQLVVVEGDRNAPDPRHWHGSIEHAIASVIQDGFLIGRRVHIGQIEGSVVGYNIGTFGRFHGDEYPLLIETPFGITKCSPLEVCAD